MALFTTTDRDAVKSALIVAATEGVASVTISGHAVATYSLDQLRKLLEMIVADLAADVSPGAESRMGMRMVKTIPPGAG